MKKANGHYRPLPKGLIIKESGIDGLGLFAIQNFPKGHCFGISHVKNSNFSNGYIRTPLGGFYNHSDDPNCKTVIDSEYKYLITIKEINPGDELTALYVLYNPSH